MSISIKKVFLSLYYIPTIIQRTFIENRISSTRVQTAQILREHIAQRTLQTHTQLLRSANRKELLYTIKMWKRQRAIRNFFQSVLTFHRAPPTNPHRVFVIRATSTLYATSGMEWKKKITQ